MDESSSPTENAPMVPSCNPDEKKNPTSAINKKNVRLKLEPQIHEEDRSMLEELENFLRQRKGR
jgi:hypothetical protein